MKLSFLAAPLFVLAAGTAFAQDRGTPPQMPTAEIAADLGISENDVKKCLMPPQQGSQGSQDSQSNERGGPKGPPSEAQKAELLSCLQAANSSLTAAKLDSVMQAYGPPAGGRQ